MITKLTEAKKERRYRQYMAMRYIAVKERLLSELPAGDEVDEFETIASEAEMFGDLSNTLEETRCFPVWAI